MSDESTKVQKKSEMNWAIVLWYIHLHVLGIYGLWLLFTSAKWMTVFYVILLTLVANLSITAGAHRLWAHQSYVATPVMRLFLVLAHTLAGVGTVHNWVLTHRMHHKFYGTDKDPYNHKKGFWYCHIFSNFEVDSMDKESIKKEVDMRDIESDGFVWIQHNFYWLMFIIFGLLFPLNVPVAYWDESLVTAIFVVIFLRFAITTNLSALVYTAPFIWALSEGEKYPPEDNSVFFVRKSLWPLYHYMVPWDWKTGEFGTYEGDSTTLFIKIWNELGWVSQLRTATSEDIREALYRVAIKKNTLKESLEELKNTAELNALKSELRYFG